jgi:diguanylate cyclase (GGDEF)-like protein
VHLNFKIITPLTQFFEKHEYNQISFDQFAKDFKNKAIIDELKNYSPEFLIPLKSFKSIVGVYLQGASQINSAYSTNDIQFCVNILSFASISIENANLFREATVDRMTKLYTHHQFQERLLREIKKGQRYTNKFSLIMFDIDHFKKFNDNYGHLQGDIIIKEIANILVQYTRDVDMPARYGGEEFVVLMPEIDIEHAYKAAERLRKAIESYEFPGKDGPYKVTISAGVGEFNPNYIKYNNDFIEFVDKALYQSKKNGRNRVTKALYQN